MTSTRARADVLAHNADSSAVMGYLKKPYVRLVIPESDGSYRAEMLEFPGCIATGATATQALESLEEAATSWLLSAIEQKQNIPHPIETSGLSGKLVLRLPKSLHKKASLVAEREGVSLNHFITCALAECVGERLKSHTVNFFQTMISVTPSGVNRVANSWSPVSSGWGGNAITATTKLIEAS